MDGGTDVRTYGRTDVRTDGHFPPLILLGRLLEVDLKTEPRTDNFDGESFLGRSPVVLGDQFVVSGVVARHALDDDERCRFADVDDDVGLGSERRAVLQPRHARCRLSLDADADLRRAADVRMHLAESFV